MMKAGRWVMRGIVVVLGVIVITVAGVYAWVGMRMTRQLPQPPRVELTLPTDSATIAEGGRYANTSGCRGCHESDFGGKLSLDEPLVLRLASPNLTTGQGGRLANHDNASFAAAVRHGIARDGRPLLFMPSHEFAGLADDQLAAILAWARAQPPVDRDVGAIRVGPVGRMLYAFGMLDLIPYDLIDHDKRAPATAPVGPTVEHGKYLASGCSGCHGAGMSGGRIPGTPSSWPVPQNITPAGIGSWSDADFLRAMRTGKRPDGSQLRAPMPWKLYAELTDEELIALRRYLGTLPPRPTGTR